jgi:hypothetical protein
MREKNEEKIPTSIILQLVVSLFSSIHIFLCFLGSHSSAVREKKETLDTIFQKYMKTVSML